MSVYREGWERAAQIEESDGPLVRQIKTLWASADLGYVHMRGEGHECLTESFDVVFQSVEPGVRSACLCHERPRLEEAERGRPRFPECFRYEVCRWECHFLLLTADVAARVLRQGGCRGWPYRVSTAPAPDDVRHGWEDYAAPAVGVFLLTADGGPGRHPVRHFLCGERDPLAPVSSSWDFRRVRLSDEGGYFGGVEKCCYVRNDRAARYFARCDRRSLSIGHAPDACASRGLFFCGICRANSSFWHRT